MSEHVLIKTESSESGSEDECDDAVESERLCSRDYHVIRDMVPQARQRDSVELNLKLPKDTYSGSLLALIKMIDAETHCSAEAGSWWSQIGGASSLQIASMIFQACLIFAMFLHPIEDEEAPYQVDLPPRIKLLRTAVLADQRLTGHARLEADTLSLCFRDKTLRFSQTTVLFLWGLWMCAEIASCLYLGFVCYVIPNVGSVDNARKRLGGNGEIHSMLDFRHNGDVAIRALTKQARLIAVSCIILPKLILSLALYLVGANFMYFAPNMAQLLVKALAMIIISSVTTVLFETLGGHVLGTEVSRSSFRYHIPRATHFWSTWSAGILRVLLTLLFTILYTRVYYGDIEHFRGWCHAYKRMFPAACTNCGISDFPVHQTAGNFTPWWAV